MILCSRCGKRKAVLHETAFADGGLRERHLCEKCNGITSAADFWSDYRITPEQHEVAQEVKLARRILPDESVPVLKERPLLRGTCIERLLAGPFCRPFRRLIRLWCKRRRETAEARAESLVGEIRFCRNRSELEKLVGKPKYALAVSEREGAAAIAHRDEYYQIHGVDLVLRFKGQTIDAIIASSSLNYLDIVTRRRAR